MLRSAETHFFKVSDTHRFHELYREASSWKEWMMRFHAARVEGDEAAMGAARATATAFLDGLPEEALRAVGEFPWFTSN